MNNIGSTNKITINDIANSLGMSKTTVSRAISGKGRVSQVTRERVLEYVERANFQPNLIAKSLAEQKTFNIGVVLPKDLNSLEMPFFQKCLVGISETAASYNYDVVVIMADNNDTSNLQRVIENRKVDGFLITRVLIDDYCIQMIKENSMPFAVLGSLNDNSVIQIDHDHRKAVEELVGKLMNQGIKKIAFIGESLASFVNVNRFNGFKDAYKNRNIKLSDDLIYCIDNRKKIGFAVNDILDKNADCIVCMDDFICNAVLTSLERMDSSFRDKIHVASLYNTIYLEERSDCISSINFDLADLGKTSCNILLNSLSGKDIANRTLLDYDVVIKL